MQKLKMKIIKNHPSYHYFLYIVDGNLICEKYMINAHSSDQISYHIPDWDYCQFTAIVNSQGILDIFA
ncbi:MAG: hypothetical protein HWD59_10075 [Coxiellaceae bacterium]|nr:MAG: hypothetical protein HWD59_10075 [Coxiellaceae bacterium]